MGQERKRTTEFKVSLPPLSPETQRLVERMKKDGYFVYNTTGKTPDSLRLEGMPYWYLDSRLKDVTVAPALLAFRSKPADFFLKRSQGLPFKEQLELYEKEKARVEKAYPSSGVVPRLGELPEWTELAWRCFKETGKRLFGKVYGYNYTWTDTYENGKPGADRADTGSWGETDGLYVFLGRSGNVGPDLGLASLVEISRK